MKKIEKVHIIGMGALGVLFGDHFVRTLGPEAVRFVADRGRIGRYLAEGVYCNDKKCDFRYTDGTDGAAELLIFAVKATALDEAVELVRPCVRPETTVISIINGITSEELIGKALGAEKVLYCVAQGMDATKLGNRLAYKNPGQICIGIPKDQEEKRPRLNAVLELFRRTGLPFTEEKDIMHRLWSKFMLNVGINQVCMVYETGYGGVQAPGEPRDTMIAAMREVKALAPYEGVTLTDDDIASYVALMDSLTPEGMPSMRQDGLARRYSEVSLFSETVLRLAEKHGVDAPVNRMLYDRIKAVEATY